MIDISLQAVAAPAVQQSVFRDAIDFFFKLGIYDVILPFLLIFTVVFAILEKTRVFGTDEYDGKRIPKKNLNAMTAFVIAFLVIASTKLVALLNEFLANVVMLLILIVMFLLLIGSFYKEGEDVALTGGLRAWFTVIVLIIIILIFLHAVPVEGGSNWLEVGWYWLASNWNTNAVGGIILLIVVIIVMALITKDRKQPKAKSEPGGGH